MAVEPLRRNRNRREPLDGAQPQLIAQRIGETLAQARERRGESIADVSKTLRIRQPYLEAIERGDHAALPGPTYAIGFVRAYAVHVAIDPEAAVRQFKEEAGSLDLAADLNFPTPLPEGRIPTRGILVLALLLTGAAYVGWWFFSADGRRIADLIPALPGATVEAPTQDSASTPAPPAAPATQGPVDPAPVATAPEPVSTQVTTTTPAPMTPPTTPPSTAPEAEVGGTAGSAAVDQSAAPEASPSSTETPAASTAADEPAPPVASVAVAPVRPLPNQAPQAAQQSEPLTPSGQALATATPPAAPPAGSPAASVAASNGANPTGAAPSGGAPTDAPALPEPTDTAEVVEPATEPESPVVPDSNRVFGEENETSRITVQATGDAWVEFRDGNGDLVFTRVLRPGDSYRVPDVPGLRLQTGNAGALVFQVDGATLQPIGPSGSVRRNVLIEPDALRDGTAVPATPEN